MQRTEAVTRRSLAETTMGDAAAAFTEGFRGYVVKFTISPEAFSLRMAREDVDPEASEVFFDGDKPAGTLLIARRGRRSRVSALGIGPTIRGQGLGTRVMTDAIAAARARGDDVLILEVIDSNIRARDLYLSLGFEMSRNQVGFSRSRTRPVPEVPPAAECEYMEAAAMLSRFADANPTWQTDPDCFHHPGSPLRSFSIGTKAVALLDDTKDDVRIYGFAVDPAERRKGLGRALADSLAARYPGRRLYTAENIAAGLLDPFMRRIGWRRSRLTQSEMVLRLD
ncbi:ribosomal protein S18 acetylase RimI-like enzyme [Rhizobium soli]|jgi:ribosomal protein S18 acetylase RimI-like enzyme|uniref:Ribosomal protein S18 acetylase RimI-like enzyme n=1 Tax=Rhizobium soli TaxID=424798 RepID=A0A7X0JHY3_9HYPH|nr:GNAT family N-acetyltransferase [Rhizobium soli]MBB6507868.1 ribosomal protein S18 acetylase RimI-like enzyme [Rhizobium soli]